MMKAPESFVADTPRQRLDVFLALQFPQFSRGHLKKLIAQGAAKVGGEPADADRRLRVGETVAIEFTNPEWAEPYGKLSDWVLHEDRELLVLNKPAGLLMHPLGIQDALRRVTGGRDKVVAGDDRGVENIEGLLCRGLVADQLLAGHALGEIK